MADLSASSDSPTKSMKKQPVKHKFTQYEDKELLRLVEKYKSDWKTIASKMPNRTCRQCRERWKYYLSPDVNRENWTKDEDDLLIKTVKEIGPKWAKISSMFEARTDVSLKNRYRRIHRTYDKTSVKESDSVEESPPVIAPPIPCKRIFIDLPGPLHYIHSFLPKMPEL